MTPRYVVAALLSVVFIIYGSLSPFEFHASTGSAIGCLLAHWRTPGQSLSGFIGNVVFYMPLGLFVALALAPRASVRRQAFWAGVSSLILCVSMELAQFYDGSRKTTLTDVYLNVAGGLLGGLIAIRMPPHIARPVGDLRQPVVWILLLAFAVIELYPFLPTLNMGWYMDALGRLWQRPDITPIRLLHGLTNWLLAAALVGHLIGLHRARLALLGLMAGVFVGQIVILNIWLSAAEWLGALAAAALWWALAPCVRGWRIGVPTVLLSLLLLTNALADGQASGLPFQDLQAAHALDTARHAIARFYPIGGLIWSLGVLGLDKRLAGLALAVLLLLVEALAMITTAAAISTTDATLALIAGFVFWGLPERAAPKG
ncbi:VanZ family protein [Salinisphaera sp. SPP-AMP-43]|uniref:VanZ family protein n=1 Tax=Salinisphaera sp. SPP-AMP-43 TaxID=3121288 RepID=UPI003C6DFA7D